MARDGVDLAPFVCHYGTMDLQPYIDAIRRQLDAAAEAAADDARALSERLAAPLDAAIRLSLLEALSVAAQEITCDMAPGSVELRLRGGDPEFAVAMPAEPSSPEAADDSSAADDAWPAAGAQASDDGGMARINLRMPDSLKSGVDKAAAADGLSVNAWLVRATAAALQRTDASRRHERRGFQGPQHFTGWAR